jgi:hypothetical protein
MWTRSSYSYGIVQFRPFRHSNQAPVTGPMRNSSRTETTPCPFATCRDTDRIAPV